MTGFNPRLWLAHEPDKPRKFQFGDPVGSFCWCQRCSTISGPQTVPRIGYFPSTCLKRHRELRIFTWAPKQCWLCPRFLRQFASLSQPSCPQRLDILPNWRIARISFRGSAELSKSCKQSPSRSIVIPTGSPNLSEKAYGGGASGNP